MSGTVSWSFGRSAVFLLVLITRWEQKVVFTSKFQLRLTIVLNVLSFLPPTQFVVKWKKNPEDTVNLNPSQITEQLTQVTQVTTMRTMRTTRTPRTPRMTETQALIISLIHTTNRDQEDDQLVPFRSVANNRNVAAWAS